jgi:hypothetical protein
MKKHHPRSWCGEETKTEMFSTVIESPSYVKEAGTDRAPNACLHSSQGVEREGKGFLVKNLGTCCDQGGSHCKQESSIALLGPYIILPYTINVYIYESLLGELIASQ